VTRAIVTAPSRGERSGCPRFLDYRVEPVRLARRLLGQRLVRVLDGERLAGLIVEVEAYLGAPDAAAHTYRGRRTQRNQSMYLGGGHAYVYFTYGMHHCVNVVAGMPHSGTAVLIRALQPVEGVPMMFMRRPKARTEHDLCSGPGKLTQALDIDRRLDGVDLCGSNELFIARCRERAMPDRLVGVSGRIGVGYAGAWASAPLRFFVRRSPHISGGSG
jgi:DNA-3-methyladenine glycosylase